MNPALDSIPGGAVTLSGDLRILAANGPMAELVVRERTELPGRFFDSLLTAPSRILFQTHVYPALKADGRVEEVFLTLASSTGETVPVLLNAVRSADVPDPTYDALVVRIRARSRWETDLLATTRALEQERAASQRLAEELTATASDLAARHADEERNREFRDAFIAVVSHELRTPITTIYGMSHVLRQRFRSLDNDTVGAHLEDIEAEADRLRRLTEDLLVLSRGEAGRLALASDPISIAHLLRTAVESEQARAGGRVLRLETSPGLPLVLGEEPYVEQVIRNYVSNAVKYSPPGTTVHVTAHAEDDGVAVRVTDEGPGFGDQPADRLFELFYRAPDAIRKTAGAGIGLFVCRELAEAMDGRVWAAAAPGGGAEFGFWLPAAPDEPDEL